MSLFKITGGNGFHMEFANGWTVSVQFGPGNYCDNYNERIGRDEAKCAERGSSDAECAYWGPNGDMQPFESGDTVEGHMSADAVLTLINKVAAMPKKEA